MNLVHNERVKLRAGALNTAATSCFTIGDLAPMAAAFYNVAANRVPVYWGIIGAAIWFAIAYYLHRRAQAVLEDLRE